MTSSPLKCSVVDQEQAIIARLHLDVSAGPGDHVDLARHVTRDHAVLEHIGVPWIGHPAKTAAIGNRATRRYLRPLHHRGCRKQQRANPDETASHTPSVRVMTGH